MWKGESFLCEALNPIFRSVSASRLGGSKNLHSEWRSPTSTAQLQNQDDAGTMANQRRDGRKNRQNWSAVHHLQTKLYTSTMKPMTKAAGVSKHLTWISVVRSRFEDRITANSTSCIVRVSSYELSSMIEVVGTLTKLRSVDKIYNSKYAQCVLILPERRKSRMLYLEVLFRCRC